MTQFSNLPTPTPTPRRDESIGPPAEAWRSTTLRRTAATEEAESGGLGPKMLLRVWQQWWKLALPAGVILAATFCLVVLALFVPKYRSSAYLVITREGSPIGSEADTSSDNSAWVDTQVQTILSPVILDAILAHEDVAQIAELQEKDDPVAWVRENLEMAPLNNSELFKLEFVSRDPEASAAIVNAVISTYIKRQDSDESAFREEVIGRLDKAMKNRTVYVESLQKKLIDLSRDLGAADPFLHGVNSSGGDAAGPLASLRMQLVRAEVDYETATAELSAAEAMQSTPRPAETDAVVALEVETSRPMIEAQNEVTRIRKLLAEIKTRAKGAATSRSYIDAQRRLRQAEAMVEELRGQLTTEYNTKQDAVRRADFQKRVVELTQRKSNAETALALLRKRFEEEAKKRGISGEDSAALEMVRTELAREEKVADLIGSSKLFLETNLGPRPRIVLQKPARAAAEPMESRPYKFLAVAALLGMVIPFGCAVLREMLVRRIDDADQLAQDSSLEVLGEIAQLPSRPVLSRGKSGQRRLMRDVGMFYESVDGLRTCLFLGQQAKNLRVIAVTSATSGEGKTSLASQLAVSIARSMNARVLVIDGDMRSPDVHHVLGTRLSPGLAEVLAEKVAIDDAIISTGTGLVNVLPAGQLAATPHQLIGAGSFARLLELARKRYEYVVIDTPPILCASEAMVMSREADGALLCALCDVSRSHQVKAASERLQRAGASSLGAVLLGMPIGQYATRYGTYGYDSPYAGGLAASTVGDLGSFVSGKPPSSSESRYPRST